MTDTVVIERATPAAQPERLRRHLTARADLWVGALVGPWLLAGAYSVAARARSDDGQLKYLLFWAGVLVILLPVTRHLLRAATSRAERYALLVYVSLALGIPKLLRNPSGPLFFDELAHWRQSEVLTDTGQIFTLNQAIRLLHAFPGLHTLTASLRQLTGLGTWRVAVLLVTLTHAVAVLGVFALARRATRSDRTASVAALVYLLNPAYMFFNSQYAYQTLGIVLTIWAMVAALEAVAVSPVNARRRWGWAAVAVVLVVAAVVTHHISGLVSAGFLLVVAVAQQVRAVRNPLERPGALTAWLLAGLVGVSVTAWMLTMTGWEQIWNYLSPYPREGFRQIFDVFRPDERRALFVRSGLPAWERLLAYAAPVVAVGAAAFGWWARSRLVDDRASPVLVLAGTLSALYVVALPFVLTQSGSEGAHRFFPFGYIGLAILVALGIEAALRGLDRERSGATSRRARPTAARGIPVAAGAAVVVLVIGNLASNANVFYRFPGPWVSGSDTRNVTDELRDATAWFRRLDATERIIADNFNGTTFAAFASSRIGCTIAAACSRGLPLWDFYFEEGIPVHLIRRLRSEDYGYLIVDHRMARSVSRVGWYFNRFEPEAFTRTDPVPEAALAKYDRVPWATKVYSSPNYEIYRLDFDALGRGVVPPSPTPTGAAS